MTETAGFQGFCKSMWFANAVERSDWQEDPVDFDTYVETNLNWLKSEYSQEKLKIVLDFN